MNDPKSALLLGTDTINSLLRRYAVPAIIAMTAASLYNMVDSIFIGQGVGPLAIAGLAITFPFMNLSAAFGAMIGVGTSTVVAIELGKRNYEKSCKALANTVMLNIVVGAVFSIISLIFLDPILMLFGASEATLPYAREYMFYILIGNIITHIYHGLNSALRAAGHPSQAMIATIITVIGNIILDWLFIFPLDMGIKGAAIATVIAQTIPLIYIFRIFCNKEELVHFSKKFFVVDFKIIKDILYIGLAPLLMNSALCIIVILINNGMKKYGGDMAVGAYGIVNRVTFIFIMIVMGFCQGMQPIVSYNFGSKKYPRVNEALRKTIILATISMSVGFIFAETMPRTICAIFTTDADLIDKSAVGLRLMFMMFPIVGFQIVTSNFFQSIGQANKSIFLSLSRQVIFLIPLLVVLPRFMGTMGVWISMPISDLLSTIATAVLLKRFFKYTRREISKQENHFIQEENEN